MHIVDLRSDDEAAIRQVAALLVEGFAANWPHAWPDLESALEEVRESFAAGRISRVALDEDGTVLMAKSVSRSLGQRGGNGWPI
jgi:aminoglycoside 6'-N-acetyltransferase I